MVADHRKFTDKPITHSMAHHLTAVAHLLASGGYARVADIARRLDLTRGSVSISMKGLCAAGFVEQDENHFFRLTPKGRRAVSSLRVRYEVTRQFMTDVLGLPAQPAHFQSCQITHLVKPQTARRLAAFLENRSGKPMTFDLSGTCLHGYGSCETGDDDMPSPDCAMECLSGWLPPPEAPPPCQETLHDY